MKDLAKIGLPMQIVGFVVALVTLIVLMARAGAGPLELIFVASFAVHFAGDALFFFQMKRQGCL
jgi:hypothetical protein